MTEKSSLTIPNLDTGFYSVLKSDRNTGHVLQISGELYTGTGQVFKTFESYELALKFIDSEINQNNFLEFTLFDWKGKGKLYKSIDKTEYLES